MQFFPQTYCHFIYLRSKYSPTHTVLEQHQSLFLPKFERPSLTPTQKKWHSYSFPYFHFYDLGSGLESKGFCTAWQQDKPANVSNCKYLQPSP